MTVEQTLTDDEQLAGLDLEQLRQLVGLVEYDSDHDPFPVSGWDGLEWVVGNATQTSHFFQSAFGMELVAYSGPSTGNRDHHAFVLKSGAVRFVVKGAVDPASPLIEHHSRHGDGIRDIALSVPDVDKCIAHAITQGATVLSEPHDVTDEHGHRSPGQHRDVRRDSAHPRRPFPLHRPLPSRIRRTNVVVPQA